MLLRLLHVKMLCKSLFFVILVVSVIAEHWQQPQSECDFRGGECMAAVADEWAKCDVSLPFSCGTVGGFCCMKRKVYQDECTINGGRCQYSFFSSEYPNQCDIAELPYRCPYTLGSAICCFQPPSNPYRYPPTPYTYPIYDPQNMLLGASPSQSSPLGSKAN
ncbi:uncharacterized protein LOC128670203 [Plodia interpunctella]|uniref:uncharacterized protein LOC128670203 n=1 Tax=Plodia interpunctella TaxID=58824 RepID=UPI0023683564|nr:uncharacterized protein LOC128670203 [Plodia interpunctella]